jgi:hypothetical protein
MGQVRGVHQTVAVGVALRIRGAGEAQVGLPDEKVPAVDVASREVAPESKRIVSFAPELSLRTLRFFASLPIRDLRAIRGSTS